MPRQRKVPITKGEQRLVGSVHSMRIVQTLYCGECERRLKNTTTQKPHRVLARSCDNVEEHKTGKIYLWVLKGVEMVGSTN